MIVTMTTDKSVITVSYNGSFLIVEFDYNKEIYKIMHNEIPNASYNELIPYKWTVPNSSYSDLDRELGKFIIWKTKEQMLNDAEELSFAEETLADVFNRIPKEIDTSFMKVEPFNFQKLSTAWAITKKGKKANVYGGLLGDTMGLGKTIQALLFSTYLKHNPLPDVPPIKRVLILCPATLKTQWGQEIQRFTNEGYILINGGKGKNAAKKRLEQYREVRENDIFFTVMNYELLHQKERLGKEEVKKGRKKENKVIFGDYIDLKEIVENNYDLIIIDEAQRLKNPDTETYHSLLHIQQPKIRFLMSGTPIEKDLENIFPLLDYLSPNIFASEDYPFEERKKIFQDKFLEMGYNQFALRKSNGRTKILEVKGVKNLTSLNALIKPYMLRRTTDDVSDEMPKSKTIDQLLEANKVQKELYEIFIQKRIEINEILGSELAKEHPNADVIEKLKNERNQIHGCLVQLFNTPELLVYSQSYLVKACLSKVSVIQNYLQKFWKINKNYNIKEKNEILDSLNANFEIDIENKKVSDELFGFDKELAKIKPDFFKPPKLEFLIDIVNNIVENNEKVVIFSRYVSMNKIIYRELFKSINMNSKGNLKKERTNIVYYNGENDDSCKWKDTLKKETPNYEDKILNCMDCPFLNKCNSRTKSAYLFQNDPNTKIIICSDAAKEGVNLQSGKYLINYDLPESSSIYSQRTGRINRLNSRHKTVFVYNLLTEGGTDEKLRKDIIKQLKRNKVVIENNEEEKKLINDATENY